jgi:hypothetical protein
MRRSPSGWPSSVQKNRSLDGRRARELARVRLELRLDRDDALLWALAERADAGAPQVDVARPQLDRLRAAQAGEEQRRHERTVADTGRILVVRLGGRRASLVDGQAARETLRVPFSGPPRRGSRSWCGVAAEQPRVGGFGYRAEKGRSRSSIGASARTLNVFGPLSRCQRQDAGLGQRAGRHSTLEMPTVRE